MRKIYVQKQLPAVKKSQSMPPALILSCGLSLYIVILLGLFAASAVQALFAGNLWAVAYNLAWFPLFFWVLGSYVLDTFFGISLVQQLRAHRYAAAEITCARYLALLKQLPIRKSRSTAIAQANLGVMRLLQGKFDSAEGPLRQAMSIYTADRRFSKHYIAAISINNLALICLRNEQFEEAETLAKRALQFYEGNSAKTTSGAAFPLLLLGRLRTLQGRLDEAEQYLQKADTSLQYDKKPFLLLEESLEHARVICKLSLAQLRCKQERMSDAKSICQELLDQFAIDDRCISADGLRTIRELASELILHNEQELAERFLEQAYAIAGNHPDHPDALKVVDTYAALLQDSGRAAEIEDLRRWVRPVLMHRLIGSSQTN